MVDITVVVMSEIVHLIDKTLLYDFKGDRKTDYLKTFKRERQNMSDEKNPDTFKRKRI